MRPFAIDLRSLSIFRMCLGCVVVYSLLTHLGMFDQLYAADSGVSSELVQSHYGKALRWSLNWLSDSNTYQYALFGIGFLSAFALVVGWHTRWATVICWAIITSLGNYVPFVSSGGDALLNSLLFWSLFLPLGQIWSLDAKRFGGSTADASIVITNPACAALLIQMAIMYFFTGISKWNEYYFNGTALEIVFSNESFVRPFGKFLAGYPMLLNLLSRGTLVAELVLPWLVFSPWKTNFFRALFIAVFMSFHIGIELSLTVLIFSAISFAGLLPFIPSSWWEHFPLNKLQLAFEQIFKPGESQQQATRQQRRHQERASRRKSEAEATEPFAARAKRGVVVFLILYILGFNLFQWFASVETIKKYAEYQQPAYLFGLNQYWNMFAYPPSLCMEVALVGRTREGKYVDILRGGEIVEDRNATPTGELVHVPVRMLNGLVALSGDNYKAFRPQYIKYHCDQWNQSAESKEQQIVECFLTYYPQEHHPLKSVYDHKDLFRLDLQAQGALVRGERHGPWVLYHDNGKKMSEGNYAMGKPVGDWVFWNPDGSKSAEGKMLNGRPAGEWKHYEGGNVKIINHTKSQEK